MQTPMHLVINRDQRRKFMEIFEVDPKDFWSFTGFDICSFDENVVKPNDGESTEEAIKRQWGEDAVWIVQRLL